MLKDKNSKPPHTGFQEKVMQVLQLQTNSYGNPQRYGTLLFHKKKINSNLVFDKNSGELIHFVDVGDRDNNFATLAKEDTLTINALVFFRGVFQLNQNLVSHTMLQQQLLRSNLFHY